MPHYSTYWAKSGQIKDQHALPHFKCTTLTLDVTPAKLSGVFQIRAPAIDGTSKALRMHPCGVPPRHGALLCQAVRMLVTPRPGVTQKHLLDTLQGVHTDAFNLRGGAGAKSAYQRMLDYLDWTGNAARMLGDLISHADLNRLVLTDRYRLLLAGVGTMTSTEREVQRVVNGLVSLELEERVAALDAAIKTLQSLATRWSRVGDFVLPDTSFYINHEQKLREADLATVAGTAGTMAHVLVPIVIVDELDKLKESKDRHVRWRAGHTLGILDEVFKRPSEVGLLSPANPAPACAARSPSS